MLLTLLPHPGISSMKGLAWCYVWWPQMDQDVEREINECNACQQNVMSASKVHLHPWEWPENPWTRLHVDKRVHF